MKAPVLFILCLISSILYAQDGPLYEPLNYRLSVENGTRSRDGKPGPAYWQNHSDYNISVKLDTAEGKIYGSEEITYYNNSPNTLRTIVLRLYPNRYMKGAVRNIAIDPGDIHDGVALDTVFINDSSYIVPGADGRAVYFGTNLLLVLTEPLSPGNQLRLKCKWNYKLPIEREERRTGFFRDDTWFIGYFYPQIAVYDDQENFFNLKGWDLRLFHLGTQEYYNDFNHYEVQVEVPEGYYVWATGTLTNPEEVYNEEFAEQLNAARSSDTVVHLISFDGLGNNHLKGNIWKYRAQGVPDFAFGTSPRCIWDATSIKIDGRRVSIDAVYPPAPGHFPMVIDEARKTIDYASNVNPGIPYPWDHITVFNGNLGGGMEFPMIANDSDFPDSASTSYVTYHEIFHNYTPFMMGLNEKRYPFMDEGLTDFFSSQFLMDQYGTNYSFFPGSKSRIDDYNVFVRNEDAPLIGSYAMADAVNTSYYYYVKPSIAYRLFYEMVGAENFLKGFNEFVRRWKGKHPTPYDFFYTMNDVLEDDFNWFWSAWFFSYGYPDLGLERTDNESIVVRRVGGGSLPVPVKLHIKYGDGTEKLILKPMSIWKDGAKSVEIKLERFRDIASISLDTETVPDIDKSNNSISFSSNH
jgi:hypothetical protein